MDDFDHSCERKLLSSHSTFGLPPVKSESSLVDDNTGVERISKAFSPPENRLAPLLGKKLFMHYESGTARDKQIEKVLKKLKGEVVEFFSRDVDYVITNRISSRLASPTVDEPPVTSSKQSTSLHNQLSTVSQTPNNLKVPVLIGSKPVNSPVTRGRAMLLAARKIASEDSNSTPSGITASSILNQAQTSNDLSVAPIQSQSSSMSCVLGSSQKLNSNNDLLYKARQLGIKILSIDTVTKWIKNLPSDVQSYIQSIQRTDHDDHLDELTNDPERDRIHEVRHLVTPCIKVVDIKSHYRPIYLDKTDYLPDLWSLTNRYKSKSKSLLEVGVHDTPSSPIPTTTINTIGIITTATTTTTTTTTVTTTTATVTTTTTTANGPCSGSVPGASVGFTLQNPSHCIPGTGTQSILTRRDSRNKRKHRLQKHTATPLQRTASLVAKGTESNPKASSTTAAVNDEPSGYCECCSTNFKSLFEHLHCTDHQQFANNSENYHLLDDVLNKLPTFKEFLTKSISTSILQLPSYLNPITISSCHCQYNEKENRPPNQIQVNHENIESYSVSQKSQSTLNNYENISKEINVPPTLNFSESLEHNQFTDEGNSDLFNKTDLNICELSNTNMIVHNNNNIEQMSKLDQEEAAFLFLL